MLTTTVPQRSPTSVAHHELFARPGERGRWTADIGCKTCAMAELCSQSAIDPVAHERLNDAVQCVRTVNRGHALYRPGDTFGSIYAVRAGSFKTVVMHREGHEQVTGFGFVGDTLGRDQQVSRVPRQTSRDVVRRKSRRPILQGDAVTR